MTALDATGLRAFEELALALERSGRHLLLCGARHQPAQLIARADFHRHIGDANICDNVTERARARARAIAAEAHERTLTATSNTQGRVFQGARTPDAHSTARGAGARAGAQRAGPAAHARHRSADRVAAAGAAQSERDCGGEKERDGDALLGDRSAAEGSAADCEADPEPAARGRAVPAARARARPPAARPRPFIASFST